MEEARIDAAGRWRPWLISLVTVIGYGISIVVRRGFLTASPQAAIWLGAVLIAGLLVLPRRFRWGCLAVCVIVNVVCSVYFGVMPRTFLTFPLAVAVVYATERLLGPHPDIADPRRLGLFLAGVVAPLSALVAVAQLWLPLGSPTSLSAVTRWFTGHTLGIAIIVPSFLILARAKRFEGFKRSLAETLVALVAIVGFVSFLFWQQEQTGLALMIFPVAMFIAFRYGPVGVSAMSLLLAGLAIALVYGGLPHFDERALVYGQTEWVQVMVALVFLTSLPAAGAVARLQRMQALFERRTATAKAARAKADQAARAKGEFLANMSHEIRTPLNGVIGLADALSRTPLEPGQRDMLGMILNSGETLRGLLSDALDLARAQSGGLTLTPEPFDVRQTIGAASYLFETLAREKGLTFEVRFDLNPERSVVGDPLRIRQIVSNLISNAVKFTETGGVAIETTLSEAGADRGRLAVAVRDTGKGFDEETKARLFNRFEQGDNSVTRRYGGSGLGLSIVRELASMMGGGVTCRSTPGAGSVFLFEIELPLDAAATGQRDEEVQVRGVEGRPRVLLAEDHPVNQRVVQAILAEQAELVIVDDGGAAVEAFRAQGFDVILMDTHMPVMDGLSAIRAIRDIEAGRGRRRTPIISLTADALSENVREALRAGADRHLAKPITAATLFAALAAALDERDEGEAEASATA